MFVCKRGKFLGGIKKKKSTWKKKRIKIKQKKM